MHIRSMVPSPAGEVGAWISPLMGSISTVIIYLSIHTYIYTYIYVKSYTQFLKLAFLSLLSYFRLDSFFTDFLQCPTWFLIAKNVSYPSLLTFLLAFFLRHCLPLELDRAFRTSD